MAEFSIVGPLAIVLEEVIKGKKFANEKTGPKFWADKEKLGRERGCYVFAFRASKGWRPFYVGKASKSFAQEVFTHHKLTKITEAIASKNKGTLVLFLVVLKKTKGKPNVSAIDEVETYLIQAGLAANPNILNDKKTRVEGWFINGVVRSKKGKPTNQAVDFKKCMKLG